MGVGGNKAWGSPNLCFGKPVVICTPDSVNFVLSVVVVISVSAALSIREGRTWALGGVRMKPSFF